MGTYQGLFDAFLAFPLRSPAVLIEFQQTGLNEKLGYKTPGDLRQSNAKFYWEVVSPYIQGALRYLRFTQEGKQWVANLQANVLGWHICIKDLAVG